MPIKCTSITPAYKNYSQSIASPRIQTGREYDQYSNSVGASDTKGKLIKKSNIFFNFPLPLSNQKSHKVHTKTPEKRKANLGDWRRAQAKFTPVITSSKVLSM